jgi:hypothetical protein
MYCFHTHKRTENRANSVRFGALRCRGISSRYADPAGLRMTLRVQTCRICSGTFLCRAQNRGAAKGEPVQRPGPGDDSKGRSPKDRFVLAFLSWILITARRDAALRSEHRQAAGAIALTLVLAPRRRGDSNAPQCSPESPARTVDTSPRLLCRA